MPISPFDKPGRFWRGNLHTHSTLSDGHLTPEQVCAHYRRSGYHFLALTDHFLARYNFPLADTRAFRQDGFTTLIGAELHTGTTELGNLWHILAVGLPLDFAPPVEGESGPQITARALESGAYVAVAHPAWYILTENDVLSLGPVHAIETYNATSADYNDKPDSLYMLDLMLMRGRRYTHCATDDAHFREERHDSVRGWVWAKAETLEPESILSALKRGDYYSSTGPELYNIEATREKVYVECSPCDRIFVTGPMHLSSSAQGRGMTSAELHINWFNSPYVRVTVRDQQGNRAWSNPIWFE